MDPYKLFLQNLSGPILREKTGQNVFFTGNIAFFEMLFFRQPPICYTTDLIPSTVFVKIPRGAL